MSLLTYAFDELSPWRSPFRRDWLDVWNDDFFRPVPVQRYLRDCERHLRELNTILQDTAASINYDKDTFQANIDIQHFKPEEIAVKISDDRMVTIEGKHEEKPDEHGRIYRHFVRKYRVPDDCDIKCIESKLSSDGVLSISAPRRTEGALENYKTIPITQTGQAAKSIEQKK